MKTLRRISIRGFKSFRELDNFTLGQLNVLTGANGVGKTNFINLFEMLQHLVDKKLKSYVRNVGGSERILYFGSEVTPKLDVGLFFEDDRYVNGYEFTLQPCREHLTFDGEIAYFQGKGFTQHHNVYIPNADTETKLFDKIKKEKSIERYVIDSIKNLRVFSFKKIPDANDADEEKLRFMRLAALFTRPDLPATILIDEPAYGLSPHATHLLADMIHAAAKKTQIIISTRSKTLLDRFKPKDIIIVEEENRQTVFRRTCKTNLRNHHKQRSI